MLIDEAYHLAARALDERAERKAAALAAEEKAGRRWFRRSRVA